MHQSRPRHLKRVFKLLIFSLFWILEWHMLCVGQYFLLRLCSSSDLAPICRNFLFTCYTNEIQTYFQVVGIFCVSLLITLIKSWLIRKINLKHDISTTELLLSFCLFPVSMGFPSIYRGRLPSFAM